MGIDKGCVSNWLKRRESANLQDLLIGLIKLQICQSCYSLSLPTEMKYTHWQIVPCYRVGAFLRVRLITYL